MRTFSIVIAGLGNVGSAVLAILNREKDGFLKRYGVEFKVVGVVELTGGAVSSSGLDLSLLLEALEKGASVSSIPQLGRPGITTVGMLKELQPDFFLEATPVNLEHGQPGLDNVRTALENGIHSILANKGPVALAFGKLAAMSDLGEGWGIEYNKDFKAVTKCDPIPKLRFSACVAGALPTINIGQRDLTTGRIKCLEAIFNGTTQYILRAMEQGESYDDALRDAQQRGIAEADPTLDVDGWDAAAKLVIVANAVLGQPTQLADMEVQGIRTLDNSVVQQALKNNQRIVLLCQALDVDGIYQLSVKPTALDLSHPLTQITPDEMAFACYMQDVDRLFVASSEPGPEPAAAAMIRDMLDVVRSVFERSR